MTRLKNRTSYFTLCLLGFAVLAPVDASSFTTEYRYDIARRLTGSISADPDGKGPLGYAAVRHTFNARGLLERTETGELETLQGANIAPADWAGFTVHTASVYQYDTAARKTHTRTENALGTAITLTQFSYDTRNRLKCEAIRMDPLTFDSPPADACTLSSAGEPGPYGHDRITRYTYDALGRKLKVEKGYETGLRQDYATYTYESLLHDGPQTVTDANGNQAEMKYDRFYRRTHWYFPSKTAAGESSTTDFEQYGYDANGNRTSLRKRDGREITYQFDDLDRLSKKVLPDASDVFYRHDPRGLQLYARFDSHTGDGVTNAYDGFGRLKSSTTAMTVAGGEYSKQLTYRYDENGNRVKQTFPDGQYFTFGFDSLDRLNEIYEGVAEDSVVANAYDGRGRRATIARAGSAPSTSFQYDDVSRLQHLNHDYGSRTYSFDATFGYNPASQIISRSQSSVYAYAGDNNRRGTYAVNGLNQYSIAGRERPQWDANGNLYRSDGVTYTYDVENRLTGVSSSRGTTTLTYDPLGRLFEVASGADTRRFLYDGDALVAEYGADNTLTHRYIHGPGVDEPQIWYKPGDSSPRRFHLADHQGSIIGIATSESAGKPFAVNTYDAYGIAGEGHAGSFGYTGQLYLPELGLYHYKARMYSPIHGRFLQTDPVGYEDQMNLYAYVGNDPVNKIDPTGEYLVGALLGVTGGVVAEGVVQFVQGDFNARRLGIAALTGAAAGLTGVGAANLADKLAKAGRLGAAAAVELVSNATANAGFSATAQVLDNVTDGDGSTAATDGVLAAGTIGALSGGAAGAISSDVATGAVKEVIETLLVAPAIDAGAAALESADRLYPNDGVIPAIGNISNGICTGTIACQ